MTRPLVAIERFFERLFERPATRLFRTRLEPVQLQRRLERTMESERRLSADRTYVPDRYRITLHQSDLDGFASYRGTLESDLSEALLVRARQRGYTLLARPTIVLEASPSVEAGEIEVHAELLDPRESGHVSIGLRQVPGAQSSPRDTGESGGQWAGQAQWAGPAQWAGQPQQTGHEGTPPSGDLNATAPYAVPRPDAPAAIIEIAGPGLSPQRVSFRGGTLRVGRGPDNDIVLVDERVSRRHGAFTSRQGALIYTDQGSTNGSFVNGSGVSEIALGMGDVVRLGNTTLTIRPDR